jgi:hypothetical protein
MAPMMPTEADGLCGAMSKHRSRCLHVMPVNTSSNGEYLFAGINTDVKPLADYLAAWLAAQSRI